MNSFKYVTTWFIQIVTFLIYYCFPLLFISEKRAECNKACAYFEFHGLPDKVISVNENTTVNIEFNLQNETCGNFQTTIQISAWNAVEGRYFPRCNILQTTDVCGGDVYPTMSCTCNNTNRLYRFKKIVDRSDNRPWRWSTLDEKAKETIIHFNVTYPAIVTSLSMNGREVFGFEYVTKNENVTLACKWINGNPPTTVRLLDSYGNELINSFNRTITYSFSAVNCDLSGLIRCEAQESFKSVDLYVECPPRFTYTSPDFHHAMYGQDAYLRFKFHANSLNTSGCNLTHVEHVSSYQCNFNPDKKVTHVFTNNTAANANLPYERELKCSYIISGTVPSLTLSVRLHHVTEDAGGNWSVTLSNMHGIAAHYFDLKILWFPAKVTNITLNGHKDKDVYFVSRNESVQIVCLWKKGYLLSTARLYNSRGNVLQTRSDGFDIVYTIQFVDCSDAGVLRCDADNASQNMSVKLLVMCPPEFKSNAHVNVSIIDSSHTAITIPFRAHTAIITRCELAKYPEHYMYFKDELIAPYYITYICTLSNINHADTKLHGPNPEKCTCKVHGVEPVLTLTIILYDITNQDNGKWRATMGNEIGNDFVFFSLKGNQDSSSIWNLMPIVAVVPVTIVAIATAVLYYRHRRLVLASRDTGLKDTCLKDIRNKLSEE